MSQTATRRKARGFKEHSARFSVYLILFVAGLVVLIPFVLAFFGSFKTSEDITTYPPRLLPFAPTTAQVDGKDVPLFTVTVGSFSAGCDMALHCNGRLDEMVEVATAAPLLEGRSAARAVRALDSARMPVPVDAAAIHVELAKLC